MVTAQHNGSTDKTVGVIESVHDLAEPALKAVHQFVDTVNDAFPDVTEEAPRRRIIDAAFKMAGQLLETSTEFAGKMVRVGTESGKVLTGSSK